MKIFSLKTLSEAEMKLGLLAGETTPSDVTTQDSAQRAIKRAQRIKAQRGAISAQTALGLILMAIAIAGSFAGFKYIAKGKVSDEIQELAGLKTSTIELGVSTGSNFSTVTLGVLAQLNFFPTGRVTGSGASTVVLNQWKGTITVAPTTLVSTADSLDFTYTGVPTDACGYIVEQLGTLADQVSIGGTVVKSIGGTINLTTAYAQCTAGANNVTMDYVFSR